MPKISTKDLDAAVEDIRNMSGMKLVLNDVPREYGLRLLGAPAGPGAIHAGWLSPKYETRDELFQWLHGFAQGFTLGRER